jgi:ribosomal protein L40E
MNCEKCKADIPETAKFCPKCGLKIGKTPTQDIQTQKCPKCGTENPLTAKFCKKDGAPLQTVAPSSTEINKPETMKHEFKPEKSVAPELENKIQTQQNGIICPQCGTSYPTTAKFCKKDGTSLVGPIKLAEKATPEVKQIVSDKSPDESSNIDAQPEQKQPEKAVTADGQKDIIICPTCGTQNLLTAKFCNKDGTPLAKETTSSGAQDSKIKPQSTAQIANRAAVTSMAASRKVSEKRPSILIWLTMAVLLLLFAGGGSYLYFSGFFGKSPSKTQENINAELKARGLINVFAEVDKDWTATAKGTVSSQAYKDEAVSLIKGHSDIKNVIDNIHVQGAIADI